MKNQFSEIEKKNIIYRVVYSLITTNKKKGIIVFINPGQENDEILAKLRDVTGLEGWSYLERLNACDVYYLK